MTKRHERVASILVFACAASFAVACGDDDVEATPVADAGTSVTDSSSPATPTDSGTSTPPVDAGTPDAPSSAATPIRPNATVRLPNAINPYGLVFGQDGAIYASGATVEAGVRKLAVWRFQNGALDTAFGTGGVVTVDIPGDESSFDLVEVAAGSFVVQASVGGKIFLVKLTKDGGGAYAFGTPTFVRFGYDEGEGWPAGTPNAPAAAPSYASWSIGLDRSTAASPQIVVFAHGAPAKAADPANQRIDNDRWITRVSADTLAIDPAFNGGVPYTTDADGKSLGDNARRGLVLADGSIVSSGYANFGQGLGNHVVLVRLLKNGTVDPGFGFGTSAPGIPGQTKFNPYLAVSGFAEAYGVVRQSNGLLVTTGYGTSNATVPSKSVDLVAFRVKPDGIDTTYGTLGATAWQSETDKGAGLGGSPFTDRGRDIAILPDDRTVHVGVYDDYASVFVLDPSGKPDTSFGTNGVLEYSYPAGLFKVATSSDGKRIAATAQSLNQTTDPTAPLGSLLVTLDVGN